MTTENAYLDDVALRLGVFDQRCFYRAFEEFECQSIEQSLASENLLIRIFAVLDRRVGKRRLRRIQQDIQKEPATFQLFFALRARAEGLLQQHPQGRA